MNRPSLPDTLSDTLALAINDARNLDRSLYHPHSRFWHGYLSEFHDKCVICLAGSIIAQSFHVDHNTVTTPGRYPGKIDRKLRAVNLCRGGDFIGAFGLFHDRNAPTGLETRLACLPLPAISDFIGWEQFESHLDSLEALLPALREIENEVLTAAR